VDVHQKNVLHHHPLGDRQGSLQQVLFWVFLTILFYLLTRYNWWSELETAPIVAAQVNKINLVSPEGILIVAYFRLLPLAEQMFQQNEQ
jgi:hypothetical protein